MDEHVYQSSMLWFIVTKASELASFFGPWFVFLGALVWAFRSKSWPGYVGLLGGLLIGGAHLAHLSTPFVSTVGLGGLQPTVDQNSFVMFFYLHGNAFGLVLLGLGLMASFVQRSKVA